MKKTFASMAFLCATACLALPALSFAATPIRLMSGLKNNARVIEVQKKLAEVGLYVGPYDGNFGLRTQSAIAVFQMKNNLAVDGKITVNGATWTKLFTGQLAESGVDLEALIATLPATGITSYKVTLNGSVDFVTLAKAWATEPSNIKYWFQYGSSPMASEYMTGKSIPKANEQQAGIVAFDITFPLGNVTDIYYYRMCAADGAKNHQTCGKTVTITFPPR